MKKTLLFDGRIFAEALNKRIERTGTYFVAFNILKQFLQSDIFDITVLTQPYDTAITKSLSKKL